MFPDVLFTTGVQLAFMSIILIFLCFGSVLREFSPMTRWLIFTALVAIVLNSLLSSSSAAPPACRASFTGATNGGTGAAYTCTPLVPDPLSGGGEGVYFPTP